MKILQALLRVNAVSCLSGDICQLKAVGSGEEEFSARQAGKKQKILVDLEWRYRAQRLRQGEAIGNFYVAVSRHWDNQDGNSYPILVKNNAAPMGVSNGLQATVCLLGKKQSKNQTTHKLQGFGTYQRNMSIVAQQSDTSVEEQEHRTTHLHVAFSSSLVY